MKPAKPQSQASLVDQLAELISLADQAGLYDAADYLREKVEAIRIKFRPHDWVSDKTWFACSKCGVSAPAPYSSVKDAGWCPVE